MLIFLDTEFTSFDEPYLISIGLVAQDGRELYCETAGITSVICSDFVQHNVLPLLSGVTARPIELAEQVKAFLAPYGSSVTICTDAPRYDIDLFLPYLPARLNWNYAAPYGEEHAQLFEDVRNQAFLNGLRQHHALDDARALAIAWSACML